MTVDPLVHRTRWRVRSYEIDQNGHVNNAVYLNYAEALTVEHAEASGYGRAWTEARGGPRDALSAAALSADRRRRRAGS